MLIRIRKSSDPSPDEIAQIAPKELILGRRAFMESAVFAFEVSSARRMSARYDASILRK